MLANVSLLHYLATMLHINVKSECDPSVSTSRVHPTIDCLHSRYIFHHKYNALDWPSVIDTAHSLFSLVFDTTLYVIAQVNIIRLISCGWVFFSPNILRSKIFIELILFTRCFLNYLLSNQTIFSVNEQCIGAKWIFLGFHLTSFNWSQWLMIADSFEFVLLTDLVLGTL